MKSKVITWIIGSTFTLAIFFGGFISAFYLNYSSLANTYTKEHVDNGRFMLWALKYLEQGETEKAKSFLRGQVSAKVFIIETARLPPTSERELALIDSFYFEVVDYFESQGGFNETFQVMNEEELKNVLRNFLIKHYDMKLRNVVADSSIPFAKKSFVIRKIKTDIIPKLKRGELVSFDTNL
jgi:hypothetical protein